MERISLVTLCESELSVHSQIEGTVVVQGVGFGWLSLHNKRLRQLRL